MTPKPTARLALVGDRSPGVRAHARIPAIVDALRQRDDLAVDPYWVPTDDVGDLSGFDGVWVAPGSPYRSREGAVAAVRTARERGIPFLGTCGGFQHALLEYARNVCGISAADHAEYGTGGDALVVVELACSLVGHEGAIQVTPGSTAERILGTRRTVERYHCSYGLNQDYLDVLTSRGLRFTGHDDAGDARIAELPGHPFFLATLFQPELAGDGTVPHPVIRAFAAAVVENTPSSREPMAADRRHT